MTAAPSTLSESKCGACGSSNNTENQFCQSCGTSLWEKCASCSNQVLIGQSFCNKCGFNLIETTQKRLDTRATALERAKSLAEKGQLKDAIRVAEGLTQADDYRFKEQAEAAQACVEELQKQLEYWENQLDHTRQLAQTMQSERRFSEVVDVLDPVPACLMDDQLTSLLSACSHSAKLAREARASLKTAIEKKDWYKAILDLSQLLSLYPEHEKYAALALQVVEKLRKAAAKRKATGDFSESLDILNSIPPHYQNDAVRIQIGELEELLFLRRIAGASKLATPAVNQAIDRLKTLTPDDQGIQKLAQLIAKARSKPKPEHHIYGKWMKGTAGLLAESIIPCNLTTSIPGRRPECLRRHGALFWQALGLALQGLGRGNENGNFIHSAKAGVFGRLTRKKSVEERVWGVDFGSTSIKALCLSQVGDKIQVEDAVLIPLKFDNNVKRPTGGVLFRIIEQALASHDFGDVPVVTNIRSGDLLARYFEVPANNDKQHATFIQQETQANVPINADLLATAHYTCPPENPTSASRRVVLFALRKVEIESRQTVFKKLGINLVGVVPEPLAYFNCRATFDAFEEPSRSPGSPIALVQVGHVGCTIMVMSESSFWFRSLDWGLNELASALAKDTTSSHADCDALRKNPFRSQAVSQVGAIMQDSFLVPNRELARSLQAASELVHGEPKSAYLIGGGAYQPFAAGLLNGENFKVKQSH